LFGNDAAMTLDRCRLSSGEVTVTEAIATAFFPKTGHPCTKLCDGRHQTAFFA